MQMKRTGFYLGWLMAIAFATCVVAQVHGQTVPAQEINSTQAKIAFVPRYYHLVFVVKEIEGGKVINSRDYGMSIGTVPEFGMNHNNRSIRSGTKVPVENEQGKSNYIDTGISIDCRSVMDVGGKLEMDVSAEVSSVVNPKMDGATGARGMPMILQNKWNSQVLVALGKPTVLFSSDEVTSKRTLELELTATEMK